MSSQLITAEMGAGESHAMTILRGPVWSLRVEEDRVAIVLGGAALPGGAEVQELAIYLPHVSFPFDFRDGLERFRHHRGVADSLEIAVDVRLLLDWLHRESGGRLAGSAGDDTLVLAGRTPEGARYTVRARIVATADEASDEPMLLLTLYHVRVYGYVETPWPLLAAQILDFLPESLVTERTLTTAKIRVARPAVAWALAGIGWKLPDLGALRSRGVELRDGRLVAKFAGPTAPRASREIVSIDGVAEGSIRGAFERFVEDLELKRHHGQIDRLLGEEQVREALAEVYRALDGPPSPGFLAERLVGICASRPILFDEGERVCREMLRRKPDYELALCGLAAIAMGRGRQEEAAVHLERLGAVLTSPADKEDATACDLTVAEALEDNDPQEARAALDRVLERSPDHEEALEALIGVREKEGNLRAAIPLYKRLLFAARSEERTREAGLRLARHALERSQPEEARVFLRVVLEASKHDLDAHVALAEVEEQEGNVIEASRILETAIRGVSPANVAATVKVIKQLARLALGPMRDPGRARRVLWRAVDLGEFSDAAALELAELALSASEPVLADRFIERVPRPSERWVDAQTLRAQGLLMRDNASGALDRALEVLDAEPHHEGALRLLEKCTPDPDQRELLLHRLSTSADRVSPGPDRARILYRVGSLFDSLALPFDAIEPYEKALDESPEPLVARAIAARLLELYEGFGMWPRHQKLGKARLPFETDPIERVALLVRLGRIAALELADAHQARRFLQEAVSLSPRNLEALLLLRPVLEDLQSGLQLISVLSRVEALHPDDHQKNQARLRLAELQLEGLGAPGQARATLRRYTGASNAKARALRTKLGLEEPIARVIHAAPTPARGSWQAAVQIADDGDPREALLLLDAYLKAHPDDDAAADLRAVIAEEVDEASPELAAHLDARLDREQLMKEARERRAAGDVHGADDAISKVLELDADDVEALEMAAAIAREADDPSSLAGRLERLVETTFDAERTTPWLLELVELYSETLDLPDRANDARRRYLMRAPTDETVLAAARKHWVAGGQFGELLEAMARRADVLCDEGSPDAVVALGDASRAALQAAAAGRAVTLVQRALVLAPEDPELLELAVEAHRGAGLLDAAAAYAQRLVPMMLDGPAKDALAEFIEGR